MTRFGYTLMTEQAGPRAPRATPRRGARGFDFEVSSDDYFPWLASMGHSPYAWSLLGAVAQVTERVELMTYVTCPTMRYHPAVVAQKAATLAVLSDERFILGLGAGENLNEHVVGARWPAVGERHDMLEEALVIIRELLDGERVTCDGEHFRVDPARLWDLPDGPVEIGRRRFRRAVVSTGSPRSPTTSSPRSRTPIRSEWRAAAAARRVCRHAGPSARCPCAGTRRRRGLGRAPTFGGSRRAGRQRGPTHDRLLRRGDVVRPAGGRR